jgi:hypothetical protein
MSNDMRGGQGEAPDPECQVVRDMLPLRDRSPDGGLEARLVDAHVAVCAPCADELRFLRTLALARPDPPEDLAARIVARAMAARVLPVEHAPLGRPGRTRGGGGPRWWATSTAAAAVLVLAVGLGLVSRGSDTSPPVQTLTYLDPGEAGGGWLDDDWMVAGEPHLDGISDETLRVLAAEVGS